MNRIERSSKDANRLGFVGSVVGVVVVVVVVAHGGYCIIYDKRIKSVVVVVVVVAVFAAVGDENSRVKGPFLFVLFTNDREWIRFKTKILDLSPLVTSFML